jgi:2-methylcitrate dehydratase PrpD
MKEIIAESIGKFVHRLSYETLPIEVIEKAKTCMINGIGIGISCHDVEYPKIARETIKMEERGIAKDRLATIFCDGSKVSVMGAAFANACLFHGRTQEDTLGTSHAGTVVTPTALAIAEREGNSGKEVIEAIVAGYEVVGAFDREISEYTTPRGFRASPVFGIFGSASAASKLLKLSEEETTNTIGFAAAFASGTLECFSAGTMEWRFEVGVASREGILASLIAKNGGKAAPTAIEGKAGFLNAFANTTENAEGIVAHLGKKWEIMNVGFKPYPICAANQTPVIAILDIVKEHRIDSEEIERIRIRVKPFEFHYPGMNYRGPFSTIGATLMSTPFCLALACVDKNVTFKGISQFTNPKILSLIDRIEHIPDEKIPTFSCVMEVEMKRGEKFIKEMMISPDYYNFDMEQVIELIKRVTSETGVGVSQSKVDQFIGSIKDLQDAKNIKGLIKILAKHI